MDAPVHTPKKKLTADDLRTAMMSRWAAPEYAIMWEVGSATGAGPVRYADAVIMSLWPSRGLELHGVEIKVDRYDWKREAANPRKAEAVACYCDRWYVHVVPGVVKDLSEVPPAWGLREFDGKQWKTIREAEKREAEPVTRPFLAGLLRRADGLMKGMIEEAKRNAMRAEDEAYAERRARFQKEVAEAVERRTAALEAKAKQLDDFEAAFGAKFNGIWDPIKGIGKAARMIADCNGYGDISVLAKRMRHAADELEALVILDGDAP